MRRRIKRKSKWLGGFIAVVFLGAVLFFALTTDDRSLITFFITADQQGRYLFYKGLYADAAETFRDPIWKATAWYRAGEFKKASGIFMGIDTADGAFNCGNALAMQGKYKDAVARYERALGLRPEWKDAQYNLEIARQSAEKLKREGGDMTGGKLEADEIQVSKVKRTDRAGEDESDEGIVDVSDAEMRAIWLRGVQTKPADFLRAKFAYQAADRKTQ